MTTIENLWQIVPGLEGRYAASPTGDIWDLADHRAVTPFLNSDGYPTVVLFENGNETAASVHRLVMAVFHGERPPTIQVNHRNGDKADNRLDNLEYCTQAENIRHRIDTLGFQVRGEANVNARLTREQVREIRHLANGGGLLQREVAEKFGIAQQTVSKIVRGDRWGWLR